MRYKLIRKLGLSLALAACGATCSAQRSERLRVPDSVLQERDFPALSLLERSPSAAALLKRDDDLARLAALKRDAVLRRGDACSSPEAEIQDLRFSDAQIAEVTKRLRLLFDSSADLRSFVSGPLRSSGDFELYRPLSDKELLVWAWQDAARGVDQILDTYGGHGALRYPAIDSPSVPVSSPAFAPQWHALRNQLSAQTSRQQLFFATPLQAALLLLQINHRDEAGRFEPLRERENARAAQHAKAVDWSAYPYTAIIVPGAGPEQADVALAPGGRARLQLAVDRFRRKLAPFILVSGGFVHPSQTRFCEAIEMRRALIDEFHIPPESILVEPYARHTTTNLRNAARLLSAYGFPLDKPAIVTTDSQQSAYIEAPSFGKRNLKELGYLPYESFTRVSPEDLSMVLSRRSLQIDASDPLDP